MAVTANSTPAPSRRAFFGSAIAAGAYAAQAPVIADAFGPDAGLLSRAPALAAMAERASMAMAEANRREDLASEMAGPRPEMHGPDWKNWSDRRNAACIACRVKEADRIYDAACEPLADALNDIAAISAATLAGLIFKARLSDRHPHEGLERSIIADLLALDAAT